MLLSVFAAVALATEPANPWLDEAQALMAELRFSEARARLAVAQQVPGLAPAALQQLLELRAYCELAEGRRTEAEATYAELFDLDPAHELPAGSPPKVLEAFAASKAQRFPKDYVRLEDTAGPAGWVRVRVIDPWRRVQGVRLVQRRGNAEWTTTQPKLDDGAFSVPVEAVRGADLEWYAEVLDADGVVLAQLATAQAPRRVAVANVAIEAPAASPTPAHPTRVFGIVGLGVGVALAGLATGLQVNGWSRRLAARDPTRPPGDFADTALAAERDGKTQQDWSVGLIIGAGVMVTAGVVLVW